MYISASEIEKLENTKPKRKTKRYTEEYRLEAVEHYNKMHEEYKKTITEVANDLGLNAKTLNDWVLKYNATGKVTQARTDEQKQLDAALRRIKELEAENEFLKKAAAFFARTLA